MSLPPGLQAVVDEFSGLDRSELLETLLEYSGQVPPLPPELAANPAALERVHECQTPFFVATEVDLDRRVRIHFDAPPEAPTTRGFAGILHAGLDGARVEEVLSVPDDFYTALGLDTVVSPLRMRGMGAILGRIKRQLRERTTPTA